MTSLFKVLECTLLAQMLAHMERNNLISHSHHGSVKGKSTQSFISEIHDLLLEDLCHGKETALLILDHSKAYNVICHKTLLSKLEIIGYRPQEVTIMKSFLSDRRQFVQLKGKRSEILEVGLRSVMQGSTLSCVLFLMYILDDAYLKVTKRPEETFNKVIETVMKKVENYMVANRLTLNANKTKVMLVTKDENQKKSFEIELNGKNICHSREVKILGNFMTNSLTWDAHVKKLVIPSLQNRVRTL